MRVVIVEDEKPAARRLLRLLKGFDIEVAAMLHSVKESVAWFSEHPHPDLILLDIQLSDGLSFEIFEQTEVKSAIIFTTAYDEYAIKAFKLNSVDYLLKPIDPEELKQAINKFERNRKEKLDIDMLKIREFLNEGVSKTYKKRFTVKVGQHLKMISVEDVVCFYSAHKGTFIRTVEKRDFLLDCTLEQLQDKVDPGMFFRINRKYLIALNAIVDIVSYTNSRLQIRLKTMENGELIVSRERVKSFKKWLE